MQPLQTDTDVLEVNKQLLSDLQDMGFPLARAARALHHSGNINLEGAINWIIDHENDPDIDTMPLIAMNIDIETPGPLQTPEDMQNKVQELRDQTRKIKEEEEKSLEREREKERIRAGKEILEAQRIADDNERKRNIASRKADKEEEKRAREKVRQKLDADKAERRRMLGLPPLVSHSTPNPSKNVVQENKNFLFSSSKAEQLRECLRSLRRNHKDNDAAVKRAFQTLLIYVGNVSKNPDVEKFRKIRITNPLFQDRVGRLDGGTEFLELCGFERIDGGKFLYLPRDKVDMALLNSAGLELRSAITNPYFGLLSSG
ncbi:ubiquitin-associated (UBA)/TS-N domain-containing protein [Euphorbia peplus]|nr:ubiquitin-associated (UBA)/TS-N domain-containing protein [Euphorbia peplus]